MSRNARNEIKKGKKIYFYDNGVRNAIIRNFNPLDLRQDTGSLWENFLIAERRKRNEYCREYTNTFFWRTHTAREIHYVEERGGRLYAYEIEWRRKAAIPRAFSAAHPNAEMKVITRENMEEFVL